MFKTKHIATIIEHLQEMGRVVLKGDEDVETLISVLADLGYNSHFESSDREYLILTNRNGCGGYTDE